MEEAEGHCCWIGRFGGEEMRGEEGIEIRIDG